MKLPGRDGHGIKSAGRRVDRVAGLIAWNPKLHAPGSEVRTPSGARYTIGHLESHGAPDESPVWTGHELHKAGKQSE